MKNANTTLVTVIIPVYNVEKYLKRCIDSIVDQTYESLEIILVDDGSTDRSGRICDSYAAKFKRIRVLHKENGGLSDARNAGIALATGEYLLFVDSDDFIALDAIEFLLDSIVLYGADISTFGYIAHYGEGANPGSRVPPKNKQSILSNISALERLLYEQDVTTSAWMKLYKREIFSPGVIFPVGKINEDLGTIYKLFSNAEKVVINTTPKYYYCQRENSIMRSGFTKRRMDGLYFAKEQLVYICDKHPELKSAAQYRLFAEATYITMKMPVIRGSYKYERKALARVIRRHRRAVIFDHKANITIRRYALVSFLGIRAISLLFELYRYKSLAIRSLTGAKG